MPNNRQRDELEHALDEALRGTFPASDPIAVHAPALKGKRAKRAPKKAQRRR